MGRVGGVNEVSSTRLRFRGGVLQYGCGSKVVSTMACGMVVAVWMNQKEGRDSQTGSSG